MHKSVRFALFSTVVLAAAVAALVTSCAEQPSDYVFAPTSRDESNFGLTIGQVINFLYQHGDDAAKFLDQASLTDDYGSLLLGGWIALPAIDSLSGVPYTLYYRNYLDQKRYLLRFDPSPQNGAVRTPSSLFYQFTDLVSYQNRLTTEFNPDINQSVYLSIYYSDDRQNPKYVDGWFDIYKIMPVEQEIETAGAGTQTYYIYIAVRWQVWVEHFSIDPSDHSGRLVFSGDYPIYDAAGEYHHAMISGSININSDGSGVGDFSLFGDKSVRLYLTGRTYGFDGYFRLHRDKLRGTYVLQK